jgi:hypothetical protein
MAVMIGVDPHKGSHTAVALDELKRRISDAIYTRLRHDAERTERLAVGPGGHSRNDSVACAAGSHPEHRLFGQATPGPERSLRPSQTTATASTSKPPQQRPPRGS